MKKTFFLLLIVCSALLCSCDKYGIGVTPGYHFSYVYYFAMLSEDTVRVILPTIAYDGDRRYASWKKVDHDTVLLWGDTVIRNPIVLSGGTVDDNCKALVTRLTNHGDIKILYVLCWLFDGNLPEMIGRDTIPDELIQYFDENGQFLLKNHHSQVLPLHRY